MIAKDFFKISIILLGSIFLLESAQASGTVKTSARFHEDTKYSPPRAEDFECLEKEPLKSCLQRFKESVKKSQERSDALND